MHFANISDTILDFPYLYQSEDYVTLREELESIGEDLIIARVDIKVDTNGIQYLNNFIAWADNSVIFLQYSIMGDKYLMKVARNP